MDQGILPPTLILAIAGSSGFLLLRFWSATRLLHHLESARLYPLWVGLTGLSLTLLATILVVLVDQALLLCEAFWAGSEAKLILDWSALLPSQVQWAVGVLLSLLLAVLVVVVFRDSKLADAVRRWILGQDLSNSALGQLAVASIEGRLPIAITIDTGHVVVGHPVGPESFATNSDDVNVLPYASGYRDEHQKLVLTTNYRWIYGLPKTEVGRFTKVVHRNRIVSANLFDENHYLRFAGPPFPPRSAASSHPGMNAGAV